MFSDSPLSLTYRKEHSEIATEPHKPATLNISMIAHPAEVAFFWSFGGMDRTWETINETTGEYNITNIGLTSYLTITSLKSQNEGFYKVSGNNSVRTGREYEFQVQSYGESFNTINANVLICLYNIPRLLGMFMY